MAKIERKGVSKKAARAAAEKEAAAKKSKPVKVKAGKPAKQSKGKKASKPPAKSAKAQKQQSTALVPAATIDNVRELHEAANEGRARLKVIIPEHMVRGAEIYNIMQDHQDRALWKFGDDPYKSWPAFVEDFAKIADISKRTLEAVVSSNKFLPGVNAETKKKIGPRKLKKAVAAVKKHRAKTGNPEAELPPQVMKAASEQTEAEFDRTLKEHDLAPEREEPIEKTPDMFTGDDARRSDTLGSFVAAGMASEAEEHDLTDHTAAGGSVTFDPMQEQEENPSVLIAVTTARTIFAEELADVVAEDVLSFIVRQWLKFPCTREDLQDMTNEGAAEHLNALSGNGKKRRKK